MLKIEVSIRRIVLARLMIETINNVLIEIYASLAQAEMEKKEKRQREGMEAKNFEVNGMKWEDREP